MTTAYSSFVVSRHVWICCRYLEGRIYSVIADKGTFFTVSAILAFGETKEYGCHGIIPT